MATLALLTPKFVPACPVASMVKFEGKAGNWLNKVIVLPAVVAGKLKFITPPLFAVAWVIASRRVPVPESALLVTTYVAEKHLNEEKINKKKK